MKDLVMKACDHVAQLIFEQIKTPMVQKVKVLDDIQRGVRVFGSNRLQSQSHSIHVSRVEKKKEIPSHNPRYKCGKCTVPSM